MLRSSGAGDVADSLGSGDDDDDDDGGGTAGGLFLLENTNGFQVGDRVFVTGQLDPDCFTICLEGDGCVFSNTIEPCPTDGDDDDDDGGDDDDDGSDDDDDGSDDDDDGSDDDD